MRPDEYEKLGWFYLGRPVDPDTQQAREQPLLYDSRDLVTHAVVVGMTGSGKTGLGVALLEEAALDGVPALVIDPKGDLANLLLTFPALAAGDFRPWVRAEDAARKGVGVEELAASTAAAWREGLASWGQDGERIRRLRAAADVELYTPGSDLGRPVSILASFAAPPAAVVGDRDLFHDRVETTATSLLGLAGIDADPLRSREHILIATLLAEAWRGGRGYDLAGLIADLQKPPVAKVGVLDLETFFPAGDRFALALRINNLLAAPGFDVWQRGAPLDVGALLHTETGKPRLAVLSLAHLSESERMFFVSLLLNETVSWMRAQPGTSSLRALVYMDEVFGYLPPVAEPPSKRPMLTLLKQARAYGLGIVLATQNPVDLDYKALSNIGTWFLGRLQTERDKARVLDGLEGAGRQAGEALDRGAIDRLLSGLRSRVFLLHNVHDEAPTLFETRWVMSYLAGPLSRDQIRTLVASRTPPAGSPSADLDGQGMLLQDKDKDKDKDKDERTSIEGGGGSDDEAQAGAGAAGVRAAWTEPGAGFPAAAPPVLAPEIAQVFFPFSGSLSSFSSSSSSEGAAYRPVLLGVGRAFLEDARRGISERRDLALLAEIDEAGAVDWLAAEEIELDEGALESRPRSGAGFLPLPARAQKAASYERWRRALALAIGRRATVELQRSRALGEISRVGESERDFRIRLVELARARRDEEVERIRSKYAARVRTLEDRLRRAEDRVEVERSQAQQQKLSSVLAGAASVAGMLFGRRRVSATNVGRVGTAVRSFGRQSKEDADVERARETVESARARLAELEAEIEQELATAARRLEGAAESFETVVVKPKRGDVEVLRLALAWIPERAADRG